MNNFEKYLQEISKIYQTQKATEHTYRPALKTLIESLDSRIVATNEPKRIQCGSPDFVITQGLLEIGHIEAKDLGISLNKLERSPQIVRYLTGLGNLILTNYLEFRWYLKGEHQLTVTLGKISGKNKLILEPEGLEKTAQLFGQFLQAKVPQINTPKELAKCMASLAQLIREAIITALKDEDRGGMLRQQLESFQRVLIRDLTSEQFADMYAQTISYGLFAARCNTDNPASFSRETAGFRLPKTNPFLRSIFGQIAGADLDERITWSVDTLVNILQQVEIEAILKDFGKRSRKEDPVVHFYETFLSEYDPKMRKLRGVYYTPEPVVSYLVKSVDYLLKEKFQIRQGLADYQKIKGYDLTPLPPSLQGKGEKSSSVVEKGEKSSSFLQGKGEKSSSVVGKGEEVFDQEIHRVLILDPAVGTGTFMYSVINHIYESFKTQKGLWSSYVSEHLLPRLFGFELLMAPYTVAHMKLGLQLQALGYDFKTDERLRIYLTNTLQEAFQIPPADGFLNRIRDEAEAAKGVKQELPIMVVLGNPPYSYQSVNTDPWIIKLVKDYYQVDGKKLEEKNPKGLLDDYVKFIRFAQYRVSQTGEGIVAFITNHGYLDNPTFRGMRYHLMQGFDEIYVLDLHGNSKKQEVCPDGSTDKNVFDIQQGVAISILIKYQESKAKLATVYHADLWGVREVYEKQELVGGKYHWLGENDLSSTSWEKIEPSTPFYLFKPQNNQLKKEYESYPKITDIMPVNSVGIVTGRDALTIHFTPDKVWNVVNNFVNLSSEIAREKYNLGQDTRDWKVALAQKDLKLFKPLNKDSIIPINYRPFDCRYTYYTGRSRGFHCMPRDEVMSHIIRGKNLGLVTTRQVTSLKFSHVYVSDTLIELKLGSHDRNTQLFPLYIYPTDNPTLFEYTGNRRPNLTEKFTREFANKLGLKFINDGKGEQLKNTFGPEDIFNYIYGVLYSPTYRTRYAEFLKIDFPRIPLTSNICLFWQLVKLGDKLVKLHLMRDTGIGGVTYPIEGSNLVEKVSYDEKHQRVYLNKTQYFYPVVSEVWNFYIGGYQVCQKWLKDRKNRVLNFEDLTHYQKVISIVGETRQLMTDIDQLIQENGEFPLV